jgi:hypothetical protein
MADEYPILYMKQEYEITAIGYKLIIVKLGY